jgi:hypothetical protein
MFDLYYLTTLILESQPLIVVTRLLERHGVPKPIEIQWQKGQGVERFALVGPYWIIVQEK